MPGTLVSVTVKSTGAGSSWLPPSVSTMPGPALLWIELRQMVLKSYVST